MKYVYLIFLPFYILLFTNTCIYHSRKEWRPCSTTPAVNMSPINCHKGGLLVIVLIRNRQADTDFVYI